MLIARVVGELVATQKHPSHEGCNLLLVQPLELDGSNRGDAVVAVDAIGAGAGDKVLLTTDGYAAMSSVGRMQTPIDMAVIGLIDRVDLDGLDPPVARFQQLFIAIPTVSAAEDQFGGEQ